MMSKNNNVQLKGTTPDDALKSLSLTKDTDRQLVSLDEVYDNLDGFIENIDDYRKALVDCEPTSVGGKWYRLGGANVKDINSALDKIVGYAKKSFSLVSNTELEQSKSIQNVCILISLLALAEGKLYAQLQGLTSDTDATIDTLAEYEAALNGIANNNEGTEQNIKMIAQTMGKILEEKNKQVLSFKADLIKSRDDLLNQMASLKASFENYCSSIDEKFEAGESVLRERIDGSITETKEIQLQTLEEVRTKMESLITYASEQVARSKKDVEAVVTETRTATKNLSNELIRKVDDSLETARGEQKQALSEVRKNAEDLLSKVSIDVNHLKDKVAKVIDETTTYANEIQKSLSDRVENAINEAKDKQRHALDEVRVVTNNLLTKSETEITAIKNDMVSVINESKVATKALLVDSSEKIDKSLSGLFQQQDEALKKMSATMDSKYKKQDAFIAERTRRNFFDSTFYKVAIGAASIAALVLSIVFNLKA